MLASEATDLELEVIDLFRKTIKTSIGDCFVDNSLKVTKLSDTTLLIAPGEAWLDGLPFSMRSAKDPLVSGAVLSLGIAPAGTSITDNATGLGKVITFTTSTTPSAIYDIFLSAQAIVTTDSDVPFLRNQNLTESTAQKIRIEYRVNIVDHNLQHDFVIPPYNTAATLYADENSASPVYNLFNEYFITPDPVTTNGTVYQINALTPSQLDGSNLEVILWNITNIGSNIYAPLPTSSDQLAYYDGTLTDSYGSGYHIVSMSLYSISASNDSIRLVLDKEIGNSLDQPNPQIVSGIPFKITKRNLCYGNSSGNLLGKRHLKSASVAWDVIAGIVHESSVADSRVVLTSLVDYEATANQENIAILTGGGNKVFSAATALLNWDADFVLSNGIDLFKTIAASSMAIVDGGVLIYELDYGGIVSKGTQSVTVTTSGSATTIQLAAVSLSVVQLYNVFKLGSTVTYITAIDDVNDTLTLANAVTGPGVGTIYLDSFNSRQAPVTKNTYVLAVRKGNRVWFDNDYTHIYSSDIRGTTLEPIDNRAGILTDCIGDEQEDRSAYFRSDNTVLWTGTYLYFSSPIVFEVLNAKSGVITTHTLNVTSPLNPIDGQIGWINIDRTFTEPSVTLNIGIALPVQTQSTKDSIVFFRVKGTRLHLPLHKQTIDAGQTFLLGSYTGTSFNIDTILTNSITGQVIVNSSGNVLVTTLF